MMSSERTLEIQTDEVPAVPERQVLVVEDALAEQVRLEAMLTRFGFRVRCANDGDEALEILRREPILLVLSDWRMPGLSGIDLCRALRADPAFRQPYFVLITGCNTGSDLVAGMDAGADDFITKPFNGEELRVRLNAGVRLLKLREEAENRNRLLSVSLRREAEASALIRKDLAAAAQMQRNLLPADASPLPGIEVASLFLPAVTVAGDALNFFAIDDCNLAFYHLDVSGHGIASAMLSFTVTHFLSPGSGAVNLLKTPNLFGGDGDTKRARAHVTEPHAVVDTLNRRFLEQASASHYFTIVYGVLNTRTGQGKLCQAGHPHPLISDPRGALRQVGTGGFPVGMLREARYNSVDFELAPGERLFLYSDGISDCNNDNGEPFGPARLQAAVSCIREGGIRPGIEQLERQLRQWRGDKPFEDDISLMAIARQPVK